MNWYKRANGKDLNDYGLRQLARLNINPEEYKKTTNHSDISRSFIGDCITGLNDPHFCDTIGVYDATDLAQLVANGTEISFEKFLDILGFDVQYNDYWENNIEGKKIDYDSIEYRDISMMINIKEMEQNPDNFEYYFNPERNIIWFENIGEGVEYFYA